MEPIAEGAIIDFDVQLQYGTDVHISFPVGSYCPDVPEQREILCAKYGSNKNQRCPRCHAEQDGLGAFLKSKNRTLEETIRLLKSYQNNIDSYRGETKTNFIESCRKKNRPESSLFADFIHPMEPVLYNFPFAGCVSEVQNYAIFSIEPLNTSQIEIYN